MEKKNIFDLNKESGHGNLGLELIEGKTTPSTGGEGGNGYRCNGCLLKFRTMGQLKGHQDHMRHSGYSLL